MPGSMRLRVLARRKRKKDDKIRTEYIRTGNLMISRLRYSFGMCLWHIPNLILSSFFHQRLAKHPANAWNQALLHLAVRENIRRIAGECGLSGSDEKSEIKNSFRRSPNSLVVTVNSLSGVGVCG